MNLNHPSHHPPSVGYDRNYAPHQQQQQNELEIEQHQQKINVNFSNAMFKKSMIAPGPPIMRDKVTASAPSPLDNSGNMSFLNDAYLSDDLAQLQIIDDKTLVNALKLKFDTKKYYVRLITI